MPIEPVQPAHASVLATMPEPLRALVLAELAVGNTIVDVGHSHPAPPAGAYVMLARPISTRARHSANGIDFYERNGSHHRGEFTDADRYYWVLEAPQGDDHYPDMDAIRQAHATSTPIASTVADDAPAPKRAASADRGDSAAYRTFVASMQLSYGQWREGEGYAVHALASLTDDERTPVESRLIPPRGWREVEALAVLDTPRARSALLAALDEGNAEVIMAVLRHASSLVNETQRTAAIVRAIDLAAPFEGLSATLDAVMETHPPEVIDTLFRRLHTAPGDVAYHVAATLAAIHGVVDSRHDWTHRPRFLAFVEEGQAAREAAIAALRRWLGETVRR